MHENFNVEINSSKQGYTYTFWGRSENTNKRTRQIHFSSRQIYLEKGHFY